MLALRVNTGKPSRPSTWARFTSVSQYAPFTSRTMMRRPSCRASSWSQSMTCGARFP